MCCYEWYAESFRMLRQCQSKIQHIYIFILTVFVLLRCVSAYSYISYILYRTVHVMHTVCNLHVHNQTSCRVIPMCMACVYIIYQRHDTCVKHSSAS